MTESMAMGNPQTLQRVFDALARICVFISIANFGTGYSSLINLRRLPAAQLKIDRGFIDDIEAGVSRCRPRAARRPRAVRLSALPAHR